MASWIEKVEVEECKVITDGAKKTSHAHNPKLNESRIIDRSILKTSSSYILFLTALTMTECI